MNARERLKEAYENVSFSADETWSNAPSAYHRSNLDLYLTELELQRKRRANRPRTVRECIPKSRLAQYANYVYNESREMSYSSSGAYSDSIFAPITPSELWDLPEVGELYRWFLKNVPEDNFSRLEGGYESPLLGVSGFEDKILKIQITEERVRNIWKDDGHFREGVGTNHMLLDFFTSPLKNFFLFDRRDRDHEWFRNVSITRDLQQLEQMAQSFNDQNSFILSLLTGSGEGAFPEPTSMEMLYSEVLQGVSPSRKFLATTKPDSKPTMVEDLSQESFTNYTVLNKRQEEAVKSDSFLFPQAPQGKFVPTKAPFHQAARCKCSPSPGRTSPVPFAPSCMPPAQTYFYPSVQAVQRWIPLNLTSSYYPPQLFAPRWFAQMSPQVEVNQLLRPPHAKVFNDNKNQSDVFRKNSSITFDEDFKAEDSVLGEHKVTASVSEELEIQALEQYSNSNENFYQELERQAQEQYASSPE